MNKILLIPFLIVLLTSCSNFHLSKDQFLQQAIHYRDKQVEISSFQTHANAMNIFFNSKYYANNLKKILCYNEKNELVYLYPDKNTQLEVYSKSTGDVVKFYFDTVFLKEDKLVGLRSRLMPGMDREIKLDDIDKIVIYAEFAKTEKVP